jgi:biopolymer transport protein ExbD
MKVPTRQRRYGLRFNITPLIDIVFLLIIFFLAASHFVRNETLEDVNLPFATQGKNEGDEGLKRLVVTVTADRSLHVGGRAVSADRLEAMILKGAGDFGNEFEVRIRGDRTVPYHIVEPIMLSSARAGITKIKWAVIVK